MRFLFGKRHTTVIVVVALVLAIAVGGAAFAASGPRTGAAGANLYQDFIARFAANLGVEQDKVTAALDATKKQMLDEAVQSGRLTQEQADKMASRKGADLGWIGGFHGEKHPPGNRGGKTFMMGKDAATILGITSDQLKAELQSGKKFDQIIADHGMTLDQFRQKMLEAKKEALEKAVSDGKMTREQADKIIEKMNQRTNNPSPAPSPAPGN